MNLSTIFRAAVDPRNFSIGSDVATHVGEVVKDGKIEPKEIADAGYEVVRDGLAIYGLTDHPVITVPVSTADAARRADDAATAIRTKLMDAISDRTLTAGELNELAHFAVGEVLAAIAPESK